MPKVENTTLQDRRRLSRALHEPPPMQPSCGRLGRGSRTVASMRGVAGRNTGLRGPARSAFRGFDPFKNGCLQPTHLRHGFLDDQTVQGRKFDRKIVVNHAVSQVSQCDPALV